MRLCIHSVCMYVVQCLLEEGTENFTRLRRLQERFQQGRRSHGTARTRPLKIWSEGNCNRCPSEFLLVACFCMGRFVIQCEYCPFIPVWQCRWYWNEAYTIKPRQPGPGYSSAVGLGPPKLCDESTLLVSRRLRTWRRYTVGKGQRVGMFARGGKATRGMTLQCSFRVVPAVNELWGAEDIGTMQYRAGDFIHCSASTTLTYTSRPPPVVPPYPTTCFELCAIMLSCSCDLAQVSIVGLSAANIASSCHLAYCECRSFAVPCFRDVTAKL